MATPLAPAASPRSSRSSGASPARPSQHISPQPGARTSRSVLPQVQASTGIVVAVFVALHLANTVALAFSFDAYDTVQRALRVVYWQPVLESVLLLAIAVHAGCALAAAWARRGASSPGYGRAPSWHRRAGWFLLLVIGGHVMAVRGIALFDGPAPGAVGLGFSLNYAPAMFYPYYFALGLAGLFHGFVGVGIASGRLGLLPAGTRWQGPVVRATVALGAVALALALLGAGGVLYDTPDPFANPFARFALQTLERVGLEP